MITYIIAILSVAILIAELRLGIVVVGLNGENMVIERSKKPGPYWAIMAMHTVIAIGVPTLAHLSGL
ncbi:hypothetical protein [Mariniblastus fucicola]|uniref:Uncharacterized protein n=1 Tax=Mariniblastus fucicola TaxID=980251 RepID=A0A5B9P4Y0_9BACT|nr:hypothetical protein [Mariniblastus fucicola]QEG21334.1 hypothetical protein MFFC18_11900 [Mariniblastus fucicola]